MLFINKHNYTNIILKLANENPILIGIGYPLNYLDCQDKLYKYLQLHKFQKIPISQRIKQFTYQKPLNKLPLCFDTNMIPYFKQLNETLFIKKRHKLGNYDYRSEINEEIINSFCQEYYNEIHSQVIYNFQTLNQTLQQYKNIKINEIYINRKPEEHMKQIFQQHLAIDIIEVKECPQDCIYIPGFLYFEQSD